MTYQITLLRSGNYHFSLRERTGKYRKAGTVIADMDGSTALYFVTNGLARLWDGPLPEPSKVEYLDQRKEQARRNKLNREHNDLMLRCALEAEQNQQP
jgi:hypothetical protein